MEISRQRDFFKEEVEDLEFAAFFEALLEDDEDGEECARVQKHTNMNQNKNCLLVGSALVDVVMASIARFFTPNVSGNRKRPGSLLLSDLLRYYLGLWYSLTKAKVLIYTVYIWCAKHTVTVHCNSGSF